MIITKRKALYLMMAPILIGGLTAMTQSPASKGALEGAWNVAVTFDRTDLPPCAPAPSVVIGTAPGRGLVMADSCYASEGVGYGVWERTGPNRFAITFKGNSFGPDGTVAASYKVRATVSLDPVTNTFGGPFETQIFDLSNNVLDTLTGTVSAVRITSQP